MRPNLIVQQNLNPIIGFGLPSFLETRLDAEGDFSAPGLVRAR